VEVGLLVLCLVCVWMWVGDRYDRVASTIEKIWWA
jgi:hypothetical protein